MQKNVLVTNDCFDYISAPRECNICGDLACYECRECYNTHGDGLNTIAFCKPCKDRVNTYKFILVTCHFIRVLIGLKS